MIDEIIFVLHSTFPDIRIYTETVEQGVVEPCFIVTHLSGNGKREITKRMKIVNQFVIQFLPKSYGVNGQHKENEDCSKMMDSLRYLLADTKSYHATILDGKITDGVLTFEVEYPTMTVTVDPADFMENHNITFKEKG